MNWEKEYEHLRDMGHTWGPGIDDAVPYTEEELEKQRAQYAAYQQLLRDYSVPARQEFVMAGKELEDYLASQTDHTTGWIGYNLQETHSKKQIELCRKAAESLGYTLDLHGKCREVGKTFSITADYYGYLPGEYGNIHQYVVSGVKSLEDCLQLVADFAAVGIRPTTFYGEHFNYSTTHTGELRMELMRRYPSDFAKPSLDARIQSASQLASVSSSSSGEKSQDTKLDR